MYGLVKLICEKMVENEMRTWQRKSRTGGWRWVLKRKEIVQFYIPLVIAVQVKLNFNLHLHCQLSKPAGYRVAPHVS